MGPDETEARTQVPPVKSRYDDAASIHTSTGTPYATSRVGYPDPIIAMCVDAIGRSLDGAVLDVGSGTGLLSLPIALSGTTVVAIEPNAEMRYYHQQSVAQYGVGGMYSWENATIEEHLDSINSLRKYSGALFGDSMHLLNSVDVISRLSDHLHPNAPLMIVGHHSPGTPRPWWWSIAEAVRLELIDQHQAGPKTVYLPPKIDHTQAAREAGFKYVIQADFDYSVSYSLAELTQLQLSYAFSSPAVLGARLDTFVREFERRITATQTEGPYKADLVGRIVIAQKCAPVIRTYRADVRPESQFEGGRHQ